jgi:hypothetical protein
MIKKCGIFLACFLAGSLSVHAQEPMNNNDDGLFAEMDMDASMQPDMPCMAMAGDHGNDFPKCDMDRDQPPADMQGKMGDGGIGCPMGYMRAPFERRGFGMRHGNDNFLMMLNRPGMEKVLEKAGISKTTISKLEDLNKTTHTEMELKIIKIKREELNIQEQMLKDNPDLKAIQASVNAESQLMAEIRFSKIKTGFDVKALISKDDMKKIMEATKEERKEMKPCKNSCPDNRPQASERRK